VSRVPRSTIRSREPVASPGCPLRRESYVIEDATHFLDDDDGRGVVVVACNEDPVNSLGARDDEGLTEHLGGVTPTSVARANAISDVTAEVRQEAIELVAYRNTADKFRVQLRDQEGRRDPIRRSLEPAAQPLEPMQVRCPRLIRPPVQEKIEAVACELFVGGDRVLLVTGTQRTQP
jgi:hypothetical protein